jgi:hypothetical protein
MRLHQMVLRTYGARDYFYLRAQPFGRANVYRACSARTACEYSGAYSRSVRSADYASTSAAVCLGCR